MMGGSGGGYAAAAGLRMMTFRTAPAIAEARALLALAVPLMLAQLAQMLMGYTDTLMVARVGALELAAVGTGLALWHPLYLAVTGLLMAESALIARLAGAGRADAAGGLRRHARALALACALPAVVLMNHVGPLLGALGVDAAIVPVAQDYLGALSFGVPGAFWYLAERYATEGLGRTRPVLVAGLAAFVLNIGLNWLLIYGHLGLPALGARGCGYATAACFWLEAFGLAWLNRRLPALRSHSPSPDAPGLRALLGLGLPIAAAVLFEVGIFCAVALALGRLGADAVAAHQIALTTASLTFMIPLALAAAITIRIGGALGAGDVPAARRAGWTGIALAAAFMALSATGIGFGAPWIAALYTGDAAVAALAVQLLHVAAAFQISDGLQVSAGGALRGLHDTRGPMLITLFAYWLIGFPFGWWLAFGHGQGAPGLWFGLVAGLSCAALLLNLRFRRGLARLQTAAPVLPESA